MIPHIITDTSITFIARSRPWVLASDHPHFTDVRDLLRSEADNAEELVRLADVRENVAGVTEGRATLSEEGIFLDGHKIDDAWAERAAANPDSLKVLVVVTGDKVRIAGDEDAPDGVYIVGAVDAEDVDKRIYVEDEAGVDFFGYVPNESIKEIIRD